MRPASDSTRLASARAAGSAAGQPPAPGCQCPPRTRTAQCQRRSVACQRARPARPGEAAGTMTGPTPARGACPRTRTRTRTSLCRCAPPSPGGQDSDELALAGGCRRSACRGRRAGGGGAPGRRPRPGGRGLQIRVGRPDPGPQAEGELSELRGSN